MNSRRMGNGHECREAVARRVSRARGGADWPPLIIKEERNVDAERHLRHPAAG